MYAKALNVSEYVAETRWLWLVARALRNNYGVDGTVQADLREREARACLKAARMVRAGVRPFWIDNTTVV